MGPTFGNIRTLRGVSRPPNPPPPMCAPVIVPVSSLSRLSFSRNYLHPMLLNRWNVACAQHRHFKLGLKDTIEIWSIFGYLICVFMVTYTVEINTQNKAIKTIFFNYLWLHAARTVSSFSLGQTGPGWSLILIVHILIVVNCQNLE
jgi:hypothetical protein